MIRIARPLLSAIVGGCACLFGTAPRAGPPSIDSMSGVYDGDAETMLVAPFDGLGERTLLTVRLPSGEARLLRAPMLVKTRHGALSGAVLLPEGRGPFPAVVLVHGSGPLTRDRSASGRCSSSPKAMLRPSTTSAAPASPRAKSTGA